MHGKIKKQIDGKRLLEDILTTLEKYIDTEEDLDENLPIDIQAQRAAAELGDLSHRYRKLARELRDAGLAYEAGSLISLVFHMRHTATELGLAVVGPSG